MVLDFELRLQPLLLVQPRASGPARSRRRRTGSPSPSRQASSTPEPTLTIEALPMAGSHVIV